MRIYLNDKPVDIEGAAPTVQSMLDQENILSSGIAVAVNDKVVRKTQWPLTLLNPDDKVTLIKVAFGG